MPKCVINGQEVEVEEGTTVIEAYKKLEENIAHYCWHPGLSIAGVCRLCVVEIEGNPRLQIACNTTVSDGMVISNNSPKVEEAVRWGLDFHLINHPLDCPICDQAGECGLQEQYMKYGQYDSSMAEPKVKKRKVVDLGPKIVLDSERCILCSRCVRFTDEVSKTGELGIYNRGDRSEIGTVKDKPLDNAYSVNTVDICPVGALTSKDFRFKQRVWYLEDTETTCSGCSTGCSITAYHNKEGVFRVKPREDAEVNGHWMCDEGRNIYKFINRDERQTTPRMLTSGEIKTFKRQEVLSSFREHFSETEPSVAVIFTGQVTNEEIESLKSKFSKADFFHWQNNPENFEEFDGVLKRGDKNPNTKGIQKVLGQTVRYENQDLSKYDLVVAVMPENFNVYERYDEVLSDLLKMSSSLLLFASKKVPRKLEIGPQLKNLWLFPLKSFLEKDGSYLNYAGVSRQIKRGRSFVHDAVSIDEFIWAWESNSPLMDNSLEFRKENEFTQKQGEFRGSL